MEDANKHQGEQAYIEIMQNIQTPNGRKSASPLPASFLIALNEERTRREVKKNFQIFLISIFSRFDSFY